MAGIFVGAQNRSLHSGREFHVYYVAAAKSHFAIALLAEPVGEQLFCVLGIALETQAYAAFLAPDNFAGDHHFFADARQAELYFDLRVFGEG